MRIIAVYDDTGRKSEVISDIIGGKGFADVVVRKKRLEEYYKEAVSQAFSDLIWRKVHSVFEYEDVVKELDIYKDSELRVLLCFSNYIVSDGEKAVLTFRKLEFVDEVYAAVQDGNAVALMFPTVASFISFCGSVLSGKKPRELSRDVKETFDTHGFMDISTINNFIRCVTGNFDSRFFNSLTENEYTVVKSSTNKAKIKAEYNFYQLLPEDMKFWFVMPFNYTENDREASYTMERLFMTDLSIKWVHGSMDEAEFSDLMDKYFFFFKSRHTKQVSAEEAKNKAREMYDNKVRERIEELKKLPEYQKIAELMKVTELGTVDALVEKYLSLKAKLEAGRKPGTTLVIGHGDPCFANALYNKSTKTLKFIDPKGALTEQELWTDPCYDIAKLSHSVCGRYDFFNNALFEIRLDENFDYVLDIPFDNSAYVKVFRQKLEEQGFDYMLIRLYEASLFLSMLPLHKDNPLKVFGFILNARNILREIEEHVH